MGPHYLFFEGIVASKTYLCFKMLLIYIYAVCSNACNRFSLPNKCRCTYNYTLNCYVNW